MELTALIFRVEPQKFLLTTYRITPYQKSYDHNIQTRENLIHFRVEKRKILRGNFPGEKYVQMMFVNDY